MSDRAGDLRAILAEHGVRAVVVARSKPAVCALCGAEDELRPYGPNGENVCFDCGMKDEHAASVGFKARFL